MVKCDLFEVKLAVENEGDKPYLVWSFYTDLPAGTQIILTCNRTFLDMQGDKCLWTGHNERIEVEPKAHGDYNGAGGRIDVNASDKKALELFNQINAGFSPGIKTPVSDELTLGFTAGARQRVRAFGRNNSELSGQMVTTTGGINVVEMKKSVLIPMQKELQPIETDT